MYADSDMGPERIAMLGQRKMMRAKMMIGNPVYECLPSTAKSCARSGECHVMSWSSTLLQRLFNIYIWKRRQ